MSDSARALVCRIIKLDLFLLDPTTSAQIKSDSTTISYDVMTLQQSRNTNLLVVAFTDVLLELENAHVPDEFRIANELCTT